MELDRDLCRRAMLVRDARFDGLFFTAVSSTGIYCRPVCPARPPKLENCRFVRSAAAAQTAGFRPCLRCRPETAPGVGAWRGTSNTVSRALALIDAGALDEGGVEALGARLGVGGRHLRRLFLQHLGATPVAVAQTRRVLLAKQLIHETRLTMTEVALASGFGSVRRFNESFQAMFGRPPAALRRLRGEVAEGGIKLGLSYRPPFDAAAFTGGEVNVTLDQGHAHVRHDPARGRLLAAITVADLTALPAVIASLRARFGLDGGAMLTREERDAFAA